MDVIHTAIWVEDLDGAVEFFVDGLGLEKRRSGITGENIENVWLGGEHGELQLRTAPDHELPSTGRDVVDHVAVSVDDVDAEIDRLKDDLGVAVLDGPRDGSTGDVRIAFIEGPEGWAVELIEDTS
ncbi:MAG: VOC family protein [Salinirussus sp.]